MINVITRRKEDPPYEFQNLWLNTTTGNLFVWNGEPVLIGKLRDGGLVVADEFNAEFLHTPVKNEQKYSYVFPYKRVPLLVLAMVQKKGYEGSNVSVYFGSKYGEILPDDRYVILNQQHNVEIGIPDIKLECKPTKGALKVKLIVVSYE